MKFLLKGRGIFIVDVALIPIFGILFLSGLKIHKAGHLGNHGMWHDWTVVHVISGVLCLVAISLHIKVHWSWYKGLFRKGLGNKSRVTVLISILFSASVATGLLLLLFVEGENSSVGLWHYHISLIMTLFIVGHTIKRFRIMMKGLKRKE